MRKQWKLTALSRKVKKQVRKQSNFTALIRIVKTRNENDEGLSEGRSMSGAKYGAMA